MPRPGDAAPGPLPPHPPLSEHYRSESERRRLVDRLFDASARNYNRLDALLSLGGGRTYRREALVRAGLRPGMRVLDVAIGTGAVARAAAEIAGPAGRVVGIDASRGMLAEARRGLSVPVVQGLAERLPFREATFDFLCMGYALRHVADVRLILAEYRRVLRPDGRLLILDFTRPRPGPGYHIARLYFGRLIPWVSGVAMRSAEARQLMRYCWDTVDHSLPTEVVRGAIAAAGFAPVRPAILFGVLSEFAAVKPPAPS